ncbi:MAG: geranylgeranyl pyrophosphate synthase [Ignavibacteria bacterium CG2_30_36_16]|nr:polyprenyl synthetase family protein [Ignavibacteria bacterium]OIP55516.1 MAG: geranylgeranyl pyrophosphate synthase [Ignavibacteria bacterium CG2_30_36_16]PJB00479.1 MAG: polyprenyl synthetase family protein [Ignavibacteria bacterium CG_4_9_14_3_um_filter_36_18]
MKNSVNKFLSLYNSEKVKVEKVLAISLRKRNPESLYKPGEYIIAGGGKRLRPLLVLLSAMAVSDKKIKPYYASAAVELLHNFTLVHDDIMDNADIRRGRPTLHKMYSLDTAILVGDSLLSVAYEYLLKDCNGNAKEVLKAFTQGLVEVCEGQSMDKDFELKQKVSIEEYLLMIEKKTAAMAEMCCKIGAYLGGGTEVEVKALSKFGKNIGIAFQIQDDLLDISADEKEFGKIVGGDLMEGKKTYLFLKALSKAKGEDNKLLEKVTERKGIKQNQIKKYKLLYQKLGVLEDSRDEIINYTKKALFSLKVLKNEDDREMFTWLANSLIKRNK